MVRREHRCLVGNQLRAFVNVQEVADAVAGAVAVVALRLPQRGAADGIEHRRFDVFGKHGAGQGDVGFEHQREIAFLFGSRLAHGHHAGDVGGAGFVLGAGVDQQQAAAIERTEGFGRGAVVRQGAVFAVAGDGAEAGRNIGFAAAAVLDEHIADIQLGELVAGGDAALELGEEAAQRGTVLNHSLADVFDFFVGFHRFEQGAGIDVVDQAHALRQAADYRYRHFARVVHQAA